MTKEETVKRIEEDATEYCKQYLPYVETTGHWLGFQDGAKSERNKTLDEAIAALEQHQQKVGTGDDYSCGVANSINILSSLKVDL